MSLSRRLILLGAVSYIGWGGAIRIIVPGAIDPWSTRIAVSVALVIMWALLGFSKRAREHLEVFATGGSCLCTAHYFYTFYRNGGTPDWVVGAYITVMAAGGCLAASHSMLVYSTLVMAMSIVVDLALPNLWRSSFLPGMATALVLINYALRGRMRFQVEHDAAERTRVLYEAAENSLRLRDEYLAIISHELKTPVTSLKMRTQMVLRKLARGGEHAATLEKFERFAIETDHQTSRLARLIEDMLDISKITNGKLQMKSEPFCFSDVVTEAVHSQEDALADAGCTVSTDIAPNIVLLGDDHRLEQVVLNLLSNAAKYAGGTQVDVCLRADDNAVLLTVFDRGAGIAKADHDRLFRRFERAVPARNISGLGLGLFICKEIIVAHGGSISLDSDLGKGTRFTIELPRQHELITAQLQLDETTLDLY